MWELIHETVRHVGAFWTAMSAVCTFFAVAVALFLPYREKAARRRRAESVLPALSDEVVEAADQADKAISLARQHMQGRLAPFRLDGKPWIPPERPDLPRDPQHFRRPLGPDVRRRLVALATIDLPVLESFGGLLTDLHPATASFVIERYGVLLRARLRIRALVEGLSDSTGVDPDLLMAYDRHASDMLVAARQLGLYTKGYLKQAPPEDWIPVAPRLSWRKQLEFWLRRRRAARGV